jgi:hypothetical protein
MNGWPRSACAAKSRFLLQKQRWEPLDAGFKLAGGIVQVCGDHVNSSVAPETLLDFLFESRLISQPGSLMGVYLSSRRALLA